MQTNVFTQTEAFGEELKKLRKDVTAQDRELALKSSSIKSKATLSQYLNGNVRDNDTAAELILFFKGRIARRNLVLLDKNLTANG